jgi:type VI secretion system VasD/TssJ family lipoprotein
MQQASTSSPRPFSSARLGAAALLASCCIMLTSCAPPSVSVRALSPVNLNPDGESLPVKVRIYALRDDARFRAAPFADLWTKDHEVLGDDRLQDPKVVIVPPASLTAAPQLVELSELPKEARFLGIVALIQHADQPDRRRAVIARKDIGSQIIELVDSSIVLHDPGDPVPGRTAPREVQPPAPLAGQPAPAAPSSQPAPGGTTQAAGTPVAGAPPANGSTASNPDSPAAGTGTGRPSAGRGGKQGQ